MAGDCVFESDYVVFFTIKAEKDKYYLPAVLAPDVQYAITEAYYNIMPLQEYFFKCGNAHFYTMIIPDS